MSSLPNHSAAPPPPVFNCIVHVARADATGMIVVRVANLAGIEGRGKTEREAISQAVAAFKAQVGARVAASEAIPWIDPPLPRQAGESERLIAVHL